MKRVPLEIVEEGSILARSLENEAGITLAGQGIRLTSRLISRLQQDKITEVWIEGENLLDDEKFHNLKNKIEQRFASFSEDSLMDKLKSVLLDDLENRLEGN